MSLYSISRHHRRRHRKKLRLGEFAELGFAVRAQPAAAWAGRDATSTHPWQAFVDLQGWQFDGDCAVLDGFVSRFGGGSLTEVDRTLAQGWLIEHGCQDIVLGPLEDHWAWLTR